MSAVANKHIVIGVRHTLRKMKDAGLIEEDTLYPKDAVSDVQAVLSEKAKDWYLIGAKRGAEEVLQAILRGELVVMKNPKTGNRTVHAHSQAIKWQKRLVINTGNAKKTIKTKTYKISTKSLGFESD